jgi:hypothetical protein
MSLRHNAFMAAALGSLILLPACNPYQNFSGEYYAGPIDATTFPKAYQGTLPGPADQGGGTIAAIAASVNGNPVLYYQFPLGAGQGADPAGVLPDNPLNLDFLSIPSAYVFDPQATNALPSPGKCSFPKDYVFDQRTEAFRHDEQGVIFTSLPTAAYFPIVKEVPVTSNGEGCQTIFSKGAVTSTRTDISLGKADGKLLAFALVDPSADVQPNGPNGLGPIHEGFYNHFLTIFIDGGYVPTVDVPEDTTNMIPAHTELKTQKVYFPSAVAGLDDKMMPAAVPNALGGGFDILEAARGDSAYSPVCEVWTYTPDLDANGLPIARTAISDLSQAESASAMATGDLVYCFQPF